MSKEKRRSQRIDINEPGSVSWQTESGAMMSEKVLVLNIGDSGALIELSQKIPVRQTVQIKVPSWEINGSASVRSCVQKGLKYRVGLELFYSINAKPKVQRWT